MADVIWDDSFELEPSDLDEARYGAGEIRTLKIGVREREELEHNFKSGISPFHKAGLCSVVYVGTTVEIDALIGMTAGCIAYDTTLSKWKTYTGAAWVVRRANHADLLGLDADDHPQYLKLDKAGQTLLANLLVDGGILIDGRDLSADGAKLDALPYVTGFGTWGGSYVVGTPYVAGSDLFVTVYASAFSAVITGTSDGVTALILKSTLGAPEAGIFSVESGKTWVVNSVGASTCVIKTMSVT